MDKSKVYFDIEFKIKKILNDSNITRADMIALLELIKYDILTASETDNLFYK